MLFQIVLRIQQFSARTKNCFNSSSIKMRCGAFLYVNVLVVIAINNPTIPVIVVPYFRTVPTATLTTLDFEEKISTPL